MGVKLIVYWPIDFIIPIIILAFMIIFASTFILMLYIMFKGVKWIKAYHPPPKAMDEIYRELMCPKCGSKDLKPIGYYTLKCEKCGFIFTIGFRGGFWIPPLFLWLPIFWPFIPIIIWGKRRQYF